MNGGRGEKEERRARGGGLVREGEGDLTLVCKMKIKLKKNTIS